jgi:cell division protein ZipA
MSQLRWSLLILGVLFIAALGWWEWRRPRQGRAGSALRAAPRGPAEEMSVPRVPREPPLQLPEIHARGPIAGADPPVLDLARDPADVPVLGAAQDPEPAELAGPPAAETDPVVGELPVEPAPDPIGPAAELASDLPLPDPHDPPLGELSDAGLGQGAAAPGPPEPSLEPPPEASSEASSEGPRELLRELPREQLPELPAAPAPRVDWPPDAERRVVALRLVAMQPARFAGRSLRQALAAEGFVLGKFAIFHKPDDEQRAVLSAASLTRPGTFDEETMDSQHFGGLSLFAVVPGPRPLPETFEQLVATARSLNQRLQGVLQDEAGSPLTPARIAILREHLGRETPA